MAVAAAASGDARSLEFTPTWAVATVCTIFVVVSLVGERGLHHLSQWLIRTKRKPLHEALEKMKEELMLLGFISLIITVTAAYFSKICIRSDFYDRHLKPCSLRSKLKVGDNDGEHFLVNHLRRNLAAVSPSTCKEGHEPFVSFLGLEQLHRFLFVMALTHVFYSCLTMLLGTMKVYSWVKWENEAHGHADNQSTLDELTRSLTLKRQSTFAAYHAGKNRFLLLVLCFFRQFGQSVTRADYLALRKGFIAKHKTRPKYDFHNYMIRSLEDEFKDIVGISPLFWLFVVCFMLANVDGSNLYFWMSFLPIALVLLVGGKLQYIIATLAMEDSGLSPLQPRDNLFWFNRPRLLLHLIHFILFQDAFELATFFWVWWQFGWDSCFMSQKSYAYIRVFTGFLVQVLCSYSTLPLYALVTQMGSNYKKAIFQDGIIDSIHHWKMAAKKRAKGVHDISSMQSSDVMNLGSRQSFLEMPRPVSNSNNNIISNNNNIDSRNNNIDNRNSMDNINNSSVSNINNRNMINRGSDDSSRSNSGSSRHPLRVAFAGVVEEEAEMSRQGFVFPMPENDVENGFQRLHLEAVSQAGGAEEEDSMEVSFMQR